MYGGCSVHPWFYTLTASLLQFSCFWKCHFFKLSSHGAVSCTHATAFSLSDHIAPSGRREAATMCGGKGFFFDWLSRSTFRSNYNCQSSLASNSGVVIVESAVSNLLPFSDTNELFATFGFRLDLKYCCPVIPHQPKMLVQSKQHPGLPSLVKCRLEATQDVPQCLVCMRAQMAGCICDFVPAFGTLGVGSTTVAARLKRKGSSSPDMIQYVH